MNDLISRNMAIKAIDDLPNCYNGYSDTYDKAYIIGVLEELPSAEKHGRWIFSQDHSEGVCTACNSKIYGRPYQNTYVIVPHKYCPNCGAKMDEMDR